MSEVPTVFQEPEIFVTNWNLVRPPGHMRWLIIGIDKKTSRWRRSTLVSRFDIQNKVCVTDSGRFYHLLGQPVRDPHIEKLLRLDVFRLMGGETWV